MTGNGYIERRGRNSFQLTVSIGKDKQGKYIRRRKTVNVRTKSEAQSELTQFKYELDNKQYFAPTKILFKDYLPRWKEAAKKRVSPKTLETYEYALNGRIMPEIGHMKLEDISHVLITDLLEKLKDAGLSISYIQKHNVALSSVFNHALWEEIIKVSPMDKALMPKVDEKEQEKVHHVYSRDEVMQLYQLLDKQENKQMVLLIKTALKTGMRKGEILALRKKSLDTKNNKIIIDRSLSYTKANKHQLKVPKTKKSARTIDVPAGLMLELKGHANSKFNDRSVAGELWKKKENLFIFSTDLGNPLYPSVPSQWWRRFLIRTDFKKIRFHDLRHTFSTNLILQGGNINVISEYLGHNSITTTNDIYSHYLENTREVSDLVQNIL